VTGGVSVGSAVPPGWAGWCRTRRPSGPPAGEAGIIKDHGVDGHGAGHQVAAAPALAEVDIPLVGLLLTEKLLTVHRSICCGIAIVMLQSSPPSVR
jgi:hypothetical protein